MPARRLTKRTTKAPFELLIGPLSITGLTAYFGLLNIGQPKPGDTVLVSAAAGAVGTMAGQIAKLAGCRVVGTAGGQDKCDWLVRDLGFDAAVDYKAGGVYRALRAVCPNGVDVYFDNTGGPVLEAALSLMNLRGRIVCCGNVSQYDVEKPAPGPMAVPGLVVTKRLRLEGFVVMDFFDQRAEAEAQAGALGRGGEDQGHRRYRRRPRQGAAGADRPVRRSQQGEDGGACLVDALFALWEHGVENCGKMSSGARCSP